MTAKYLKRPASFGPEEHPANLRYTLCTTLALGTLIMLILCAIRPLDGQNISVYSSIVGVVKDQSGAVVPGVRVTATNVNTGISSSATSDNSGYFRIDNLIAGTYRVTGEHTGFQTYEKQGVILSSAKTVRADMTLQVGTATQTVSVTAATPMINTESGQISTLSSWNNLKFSPTNVPNFYTKLALSPGSVTSNPGFYVSFEGSRTTNYSYSIDGSSMRFPLAAHGINGNFNEYEQELQVDDVNNSAQYSSIAEINVTTKSGTNQWHGSGVEYYFDAGMTSRDPFVVLHTRGVNNLFATSLGGPIKKNKAFFFASYSGSRMSSPKTIQRTAPTQAMRSGDFSAFSTKIIDPTTRQPFPGNVIPQTRLSSVSKAFVNRFYPLPNFGNTAVFSGNNYLAFVPQAGREDNVSGRVDYHASERNSMFVSYDYDDSPCGVGRCFTGAFPTVGFRLGHRRDQVLSISDLFTFSTNLYNQLNIAWARDENLIRGQVYGPDVQKLLGIQGITPVPQPAIPVMNIVGVTTVTQQSNFNILGQNFTISDNLGYITGRHRLKFGVLNNHGDEDQFPFTPDNFYGNFTFDGFASGNPFADFLLGIPHTSSQYNGNEFDRAYYQGQVLEFYGEDAFQVTQKLTADFGLRYEYHQPFIDSAGRNYTYNPATGQIIVPASKNLALVNPLLSNKFQVVTAQQAGYPSRLVNFSKLNFAPRIGFAFRLRPSLVVRSAYGIYYDFAPPFQNNLAPFIPSQSYPPNQIVNGAPLFQFPNPFPPAPITGVGVGSLALTPTAKNLPVPYTQQWNLTAEKQFGLNTSLRVSYIGNHAIDGEWTYDINVPLPSTTPFATSRRPNPLFGPITFLGAGGHSNYNALELRVEHRGRGGFYISSSLDWAKELGAAFDKQFPSTLDPFDRDLDYGPIPWEPSLRSVTQLNWQVPVGKGRPYGASMPHALQWILGNWQTTDILTASTGDHLTPSYSGYDSTGTGITSGRPDLVGNPNVQNPSINEWFNPAAFAIPGAALGSRLTAPSAPIGRFGTAGVGIITGPGWWQNDWGLIKQFPVKERLTFSVFLLATNVFNHINLGDPSGSSLNISSPGGQPGKIFGMRYDVNASGIGPRQYQIGARLDF